MGASFLSFSPCVFFAMFENGKWPLWRTLDFSSYQRFYSFAGCALRSQFFHVPSPLWLNVKKMSRQSKFNHLPLSAFSSQFLVWFCFKPLLLVLALLSKVIHKQGTSHNHHEFLCVKQGTSAYKAWKTEKRGKATASLSPSPSLPSKLKSYLHIFIFPRLLPITPC